MKTIQPEGPYVLGGYSFGGLIAFEMAQQLYRQGEEIALLFLLEPISPAKFSSEEVAEIISPNSKKKTHCSLKNKSKGAISKIVGVSFNVFKAILNSGLPLPSALRVDYVSILYRLSRNKHFAHTYPGRIIIYKVKQKSTVDIFTWEQLAKGGEEIKEMDLRSHRDLIATENESAWINGLKDYLEKAQASCSAKLR